MANKTVNYGLTKPLGTEYYDVNVQNGNMDIIDREIKTINDNSNKRIDDIDAKISDMQLSEFKTDVLLTSLDKCNGGFVSTELYGRTLVNLTKFTTVGKEPTINNYYVVMSTVPTSGRTVTIVNSSTLKTSLQIYEGGAWKRSYVVDGMANVTISSTEVLYSIYGLEKDGWNDTNKNELARTMVISEPINFRPAYFEGMKHVGQYNLINGKYIAKNLFDGQLVSGIWGSGGIPSNDVDYLRSKDKFGVLPNVTICISDNMNYKYDVCWYDSNSTFISRMTFANKFTSPSNASYMAINTNPRGQNNINLKVQVEIGDNPTVFENYYEGVKIENLSKGSNFIRNGNGEEGVGIWTPRSGSTGFVYNTPKIFTAIQWDGLNQTMTLERNTTYILSYDLGTNGDIFIFNPATNNGSGINIINRPGYKTLTPIETTKVTISIQNKNPGTNVVTFSNIQLRKLEGVEEVKPYESYKEDKTEILSPQPLTRYDYVDNKGILHLSSYIDVYDGSELWKVSSYGNNTFSVTIKNGRRARNGICDKYSSITTPELNKKTGFYATSSVNLIVTDLSCASLDDFKAKLKANPITITYQEEDNNLNIVYRDINLNKTLISRGYPNGYLQINAGAVQPTAKGTYSINMGERVGTIEDTVEVIKDDVQDLQSAMIVVSGTIGDLNSKTKTLSEKDISLEQRIEDLSKQITDMKNSIWIA